MSRKFQKILCISFMPASLSLAMEATNFSAFDCRDGYHLRDISALNLNFVGDSLKLLPSDDNVLSITAIGSDERLKSLQFRNENGTLRLTSKPISGNNSFTSNNGTTFTQSFSWGGCFFTQTQHVVGPQNNEPVDIVKHLDNPYCVSSMMSGQMSTGGLTLQNFTSHNNKFIAGTIVRGRMLLNSVVYPTGAKFENGKCVYNPGESASEEASNEAATNKSLSLTIKMPITLPTTLNVSAPSLFIDKLETPLSLTLNGSCITSISSLKGNFVGDLNGSSSVTIQDYLGGTSFSTSTDGHSKLSVSSSSDSSIHRFLGTTKGHSTIRISTPITNLQISAEGHSTATFTKPVTKIERKNIGRYANVYFK